MSDWAEINSSIGRCRRSSDPRACLERLFNLTGDGHVAFALGELMSSAGDITSAVEWFRRAEQRYPLRPYQEKARTARLALEAQAQRADVLPQETDTLYIVSCTKEKIWDTEPGAARFVPARSAYLGAFVRNWLGSTQAETARWLILSARYGFIDPDQPICNYDVTFSDQATGPITDSALVAQAAHQRRWPDNRPLSQFKVVRVFASRDYLAKVRTAFEPLGAMVTAVTLEDLQGESFPF